MPNNGKIKVQACNTQGAFRLYGTFPVHAMKLHTSKTFCSIAGKVDNK